MKSEIDSISFGVCVFSFVTEVYFFLYRKLWNMGTKQYVYEYKVLDLAEWWVQITLCIFGFICVCVS